MKKTKSIHFVGIKGVGMTPLAIIAKEAGIRVSGCDVAEEFITDEPLAKSRIRPLVGFSKDHLKGVDLIVATGAHGGFDNPEVKAGRAMGIRVLSQGEAVGVFMDGEVLGKRMVGISVAGTHGKTTTTAMLATIFKEGGLDPSFIVGTGLVPSLSAPGHFGKGKYFIAEADEYVTEPAHDRRPKFLWQQPGIAVFTNIELDHPDVYEASEDIEAAFLLFVRNVVEGGVVVGCGDDTGVKNVLRGLLGSVVTYGKSSACDYRLEKVRVTFHQTFFWVSAHSASLGEFVLKVPGEHNAMNALGAAVAAIEAGISLENVKKGLLAFSGTKRRFEFVGQLLSGALLYDDYAHHPTEIDKTLKTFRQVYPKSKIVCIFQPHTYSRTKKLFEQFLRSFSNADIVVLTDIYPSLREVADPTVSSKVLASAMKQFHKDVIYVPKLNNVVEYIDQNSFGPGVVVVTMGAGDIYKISEKLSPREAGKAQNLYE